MAVEVCPRNAAAASVPIPRSMTVAPVRRYQRRLIPLPLRSAIWSNARKVRRTLEGLSGLPFRLAKMVRVPESTGIPATAGAVRRPRMRGRGFAEWMRRSWVAVDARRIRATRSSPPSVSRTSCRPGSGTRVSICSRKCSRDRRHRTGSCCGTSAWRASGRARRAPRGSRAPSEDRGGLRSSDLRARRAGAAYAGRGIGCCLRVIGQSSTHSGTAPGSGS